MKKPRKAMRKEWLGQHAAGVYDFSVVREYDDVVREAKRNGTEVHMARIHGICVEKNYQLPKGNPSRKFKGRGVLLGNQVKKSVLGSCLLPKTWATHLQPLRRQDGQIFMVACRVMV